MGIYYFPCEFVFWKKNEQHSKLKGDLIKNIMSTVKMYEHNIQGTDRAFTSYGKKCEFLLDPSIVEPIVVEPFKEMITKFNSRTNIDKLNIDNINIAEAWYTKYDVGGSFKFHTHHEGETIVLDGIAYRRAFSLIYVLNDTNDKNVTEFFLPGMCKTSAFQNSEFRFNTGDIPDISEGSIIIFPSSLYHQVLPVVEPGRITISYNLLCSYDGQTKMSLTL